MTDWFARPILDVKDVEASVRFYIDLLGFTSPWRYEENSRAHVAQIDRQGCALILADTRPEKIGRGLTFISLNVEPATRETAVAALDALRAELEEKGVLSSGAHGGTSFWSSMTSTAISSCSTIRTSLQSGEMLIRAGRPFSGLGTRWAVHTDNLRT